MDRSEYIKILKIKIDKWGRELSTLEDDVERSNEDDKTEYQSLMQDVFRNYESIESRLDELEQMTEDAFADERPMLDERINEFEQQLAEAREGIKDV